VTVLGSKPDLKASGFMFFINDSACVATEEMVEADLSFDDQSDIEKPCISEEVFNPLPSLPNKEAAPEASVELSLEALLAQSAILKEELSALGLSPFPKLLKAEPMPGVLTEGI
jgi:hypothetical protein